MKGWKNEILPEWINVWRMKIWMNANINWMDECLKAEKMEEWNVNWMDECLKDERMEERNINWMDEGWKDERKKY